MITAGSAKAIDASGHILVGIHGTPASLRALRWAADEAYRRCVALRAVYVCQAPGQGRPGTTDATPEAGHPGRQAAAVLDQARNELASGPAIVAVGLDWRRGSPADELTRFGDAAGMLVLGMHECAAPEEATDMVAYRVASRAACPVTIVPAGTDVGTRSGRPTVLVGLTRSSGVLHALDAAFAHAQRLGGEVLAVHPAETIDHDINLGAGATCGGDHHSRSARSAMCELLDEQRVEYPAVPVRIRAVPGPLPEALVAASAQASLLVVDRQLRARAQSGRPGWTVSALLAGASCPVQFVGAPIAPPPHTAGLRVVPQQGPAGVHRQRAHAELAGALT